MPDAGDGRALAAGRGDRRCLVTPQSGQDTVKARRVVPAGGGDGSEEDRQRMGAAAARPGRALVTFERSLAIALRCSMWMCYE
ncbi:hypothetical protein [Polymorphobacter fuscus]|uniref:hypothetical protein n=1 Tax=Sandarakinorhabdus fusca TaxID=1439888 RepID=UPI001430C205|nr:hypothetical protein [Polymorphobacter fuscus]NJC10053.1 hypothetical protein [Polymorphobacter fuscus]